MKKLIIIFLTILLGLSTVSALDQDESLVGWYPLTDNATDISWSENGETSTGATFSGTEVSFDGINDYINTNYNSRTSISTYSFWIKSTSSTDGVLMGVDGNDRLQLSQNFGSVDGKFRFYTKQGNVIKTKAYFSEPSFNDGFWHHFLLINDISDGSLNVYFDGGSSVVSYDNQVAGTSHTLTGSIYLGANNNLPTANVFVDGELKDFAIFNKDFTSGEVTELYTNGITAVENPLSVEEFLGVGVSFTKSLELSNGKLAIGYMKSSNNDHYLKICDLDGTNCGSEIAVSTAGTGNSNGLDMIEDTTNNKILYLAGDNARLRVWVRELDGSANTFFTPNTGSTNYISAVQTSSTEFAIAYTDSSNYAQAIICQLDGSSCDSSVSVGVGVTSPDLKIIKTSEDKLIIASSRATTNAGLYESSSTTLSFSYLSYFHSASTSHIDIIEGSDNKLKIVYRDGNNANRGSFISCDLDGTSCSSEIGMTSNSMYHTLTEIDSRIFLNYQDTTGGATGESVNFNLIGGDISSVNTWSSNAIAYTSSIFTSNNQLLISYGDTTASKGMFALYSLTPPIPDTPIISYNITNSSYVNYKPTLALSSLTNTNMSYILNSGSETSICNECNTTEFNIDTLDFTESNPVQLGAGVYSDNTSANQWCMENYGVTYISYSGSAPLQNYIYDGANWIYQVGDAGSNGVISSIECDLFIEGTNNFTFISNDVNGQTNNSLTLTYDVTNPLVFDYIANESSNYFLDFNSSTCTDTNSGTCSLNIQSTDYDLLTLTNATVTNNGYSNYTITATDLAGNIATATGQYLFNPLVALYFEFEATPITNFTLGGVYYTDFASIDYYNSNLAIGNNTLLFSKIGSAVTNVSFITALTGTLNQTFEITQSKIVLSIYDRETSALITQNSDVTLIGTQGFSGNTSTGLLNITDINFISEQYQMIVESSGYGTETVFFTYDNQEELNVDVYLLSSSSPNIGYVNIVAVADTGQFVNGAICYALEWIPSASAFETRASSQTNLQGSTQLNIEIGNKAYTFRCTKDGASADTGSAIITATGSTVTITLNTATSTSEPALQGFTYSLTNSTYNSTHQRITYSWEDTNGLSVEGCLRQYKIIGINEILLSENCASSSNNEVQLIENVNNTFNVEFKGFIDIDGEEEHIDSIVFLGTNAFGSQLSKYRLDVFLPIFLIFLGMVVGLSLKPQNIYISVIGTFCMGWIAFIIVPTLISFNIAFIVSLISGFMLWAGARQ